MADASCPLGFAPAKINLYLHVTGRRADGYHLLDSLAVFAGVGDNLAAEPADDLRLSLEGPFAEPLRQETDNLVLRAARALADHAGIPARAHLTLRKTLPIASGIGGGSADAAAALRACADLWNLRQDKEDWSALATGLGADVPVCLDSRPARMSGIGEVLSAAPALPDCGLVLINPGVAVSTPEIFRARRGTFSSPATLPASWPDSAAMARDLAELGNDLTEAAVTLCPVIGTVLETLAVLEGCRLARMSGSGATCWGLFDTVDQAERAVRRVDRPGWWCWGGGLYRG